MTTQEFIDAIKAMSVTELNDLVKACEEEFGVSAAAGVVVAAAGGDAGAAAGEEKDEFDVELTDVGGAKVKVIKVVREVTGLGLKEAKELVDGAPKVVKEGASKEEAESIKAKLEAEGAKVTLKSIARKQRATYMRVSNEPRIKKDTPREFTRSGVSFLIRGDCRDSEDHEVIRTCQGSLLGWGGKDTPREFTRSGVSFLIRGDCRDNEEPQAPSLSRLVA